jgi:hypothetical protein
MGKGWNRDGAAAAGLIPGALSFYYFRGGSESETGQKRDTGSNNCDSAAKKRGSELIAR